MYETDFCCSIETLAYWEKKGESCSSYQFRMISSYNDSIQKLSTVYPGLKTKRDSPVQGRSVHIRLRTAQIRESLFHGGINLFFSHKLGPSFLNFKLKWCLCV